MSNQKPKRKPPYRKITLDVLVPNTEGFISAKVAMAIQAMFPDILDIVVVKSEQKEHPEL